MGEIDFQGLDAKGLSHVNRRGVEYFLRKGRTRTGKPKYYFTQKTAGCAVAEVPDEYEIYEHPENAQVFLRRKKPIQIRELETAAVDEAVRTQAGLSHYVVDAESQSLVVYLPTVGGDLFGDEDRFWPLGMRARHMDSCVLQSTYHKMMKFVLSAPKRRLFNCHRWCIRGGRERWHLLDCEKPLNRLLGIYIEHLGKESFYDLM